MVDYIWSISDKVCMHRYKICMLLYYSIGRYRLLSINIQDKNIVYEDELNVKSNIGCKCISYINILTLVTYVASISTTFQNLVF